MGLLALDREINETIVITCPDGTRLEIIQLAVHGKRSTIGVKAPREYTINRSELQDQIDAENEVAKHTV